MPKRNKNYPCLCEVTKPVLFFTRIFGILPIKSNEEKYTKCTFVTSAYLIVYSVSIQIIYFMYCCLVFSIRWSCSQDKSYKDTDWYLMTVGYFVADVDSMMTIFLGAIGSKRVCRVLESLSKMDSSIIKAKQLQKNISRMIGLLLVYFIIIFSSSLHSSISLPHNESNLLDLTCPSLDSAFVVSIRGFAVIFQIMQVAIVYMFVVLTEEKFEYLSDAVSVAIEKMHSVNGKKNCSFICMKTRSYVCTSKEEPHMKTEDKFERMLNHLAEMHLQTFKIVNEINYCTGLQLLIGNCSSLYTMVYYLFRYITFSVDEDRIRRTKVHYVIAFLYRASRVVGYMILGQHLHDKSLLPLRTMQQSRITSLPSHLQQQLQTLMMQWNGKSVYLSACGVIKFGPWLLTPIAGNVITYLLVALQFDEMPVNDSNTTSVEQSLL